MIKIENIVLPSPEQWNSIIMGARNPMNSWGKSDSGCVDFEDWDCGHGISNGNGYAFVVGENDLGLMKRLRNAGTDHRKFMRMITVYADITAPLYWWKEFDTYKVGTVANSCSTMHKIQAKEFTLEDFSCEHLLDMEGLIDDMGTAIEVPIDSVRKIVSPRSALCSVVKILNESRRLYLETKDKNYWWQMIQLLPSSYNQKRTVMLNYEVLANIYKSRKAHKLDEWAEHNKSTCSMDAQNDCKNQKEYLLCEDCSVGKGFCDWIKTLPYSGLITGKETE